MIKHVFEIPLNADGLDTLYVRVEVLYKRVGNNAVIIDAYTEDPRLGYLFNKLINWNVLETKLN